jgi:hypothetical protein
MTNRNSSPQRQAPSADVSGEEFNMVGACFDPAGRAAENWPLSPIPAIGRATTLVMAVACGATAITVYCNQPMLGIHGGCICGSRVGDWSRPDGHTARLCGWAFAPGPARGPNRTTAPDLALADIACISLAAAALAPDAWALVVISALLGITSSVAQQIDVCVVARGPTCRRSLAVGSGLAEMVRRSSHTSSPATSPPNLGHGTSSYASAGASGL